MKRSLLLCVLTLALVCVPGSVKAQSFVYVTNEFDNTIGAYTIDTSTGALIPVSGSPFPTGTGPYAFPIAVDPSGHFLYVGNYALCDPGSVSAYTITPTGPTAGALTAVPGSPFPAGDFPGSVALDYLGRFVYDSNYYSNVTAQPGEAV